MLIQFLAWILIVKTSFSLGGRVGFWGEVSNKNILDDELNQILLIRLRQDLYHASKLQPRIRDDQLTGNHALRYLMAIRILVFPVSLRVFSDNPVRGFGDGIITNV